MNAVAFRTPLWDSASRTVLRQVDGFTFPEVLAAMLLAAAVIPVALKGISIANRVSVLAERQAIAIHLAEGHLNELVVTEQWQSTSAKGSFGSEWSDYRWILVKENWGEDNLYLLTVIVYFPVQGREQYIRLSTLVEMEESS